MPINRRRMILQEEGIIFEVVSSCYKSTPIYTYWYATHHMPFYFLPHDYSYDLISLSMLIITIFYLYSDGILSDLHHPLRRHTPYCSYLFHTHSDLCQTFLTTCSLYLTITIGRLDTS